MKKYLSILLLIVFIIPSIASASWWNPFSWKVFHKKQTPQEVQVIQEKNPNERINELQKQLDELKNQKPITTSQEIIPTAKKEVIKNDSESKKISSKENIDLCNEIEGIQTIVPLGYIKNGSGPCVLLNPTVSTSKKIQDQPVTVPITNTKPILSLYQNNAYYDSNTSYWYIKFNLSNKSDTDIGLYAIDYSISGINLIDRDNQKMTISVEGISSPEESIGVNSQSYRKEFSPNIIFPAHESKVVTFKYKPSYINLEWNKSYIEIKINSIVTSPISSISLPISNRAISTK